MPIDQYGIKYDEPRTLDFNRQEATRKLSADSGDVGSVMNISNKNAGAVAESVPDASTQFSNAMVSMLKQYQTLGTKPLQEKGIGLQQEQLGRVQAEATPGFSPGQQASIRGAEAGAIDPSIQGTAQRAKTFGEQISGLGDALGNIKNLMTSYTENQNKVRDDARAMIKDALTLRGGDAFSGVDSKELSSYEKLAGYPKGFLEHAAMTIKEREMQQKKEKDLADLEIKKTNEANRAAAYESAALSRQQKLQIINQEEDDKKRNGQLLYEGYSVPSLLGGLGKNKAALVAEADRISMKETGKHYNEVQAELQFNAAKRFVTSLNSTQQTRFNMLGTSVVNTIDEVRKLADLMGQSGVTFANKAELEAQRNLLGNTEKGQMVSQYLAAVNTLKEEFANLAQGGYAPTEATWDLANKQINENYGVKQLNASLTEVQRLINFRLGAQSQLTPQYGGLQGNLQVGLGQKNQGEQVESKTEDLSTQVTNAGYDYNQMKADGYSDEEIKSSLNLK